MSKEIPIPTKELYICDHLIVNGGDFVALRCGSSASGCPPIEPRETLSVWCLECAAKPRRAGENIHMLFQRITQPQEIKLLLGQLKDNRSSEFNL